jgi:hypothetical protein
MRRNRSFTGFVVLVLAAMVQGQEPARKPLHPNPGRALRLEEVLKINGEGPGYYYEGASGLEIDREGGLYVRDSWSSARPSHLLKFAPDGRFLKDLYRQGEGPGEIQSAFDFALTDSEVFLFDYEKRKIVVLSPDGEYRTEIRNPDFGFNDLLGVFDGGLVFKRVERPAERPTSRLYDLNNVFVRLTKDGRSEKRLAAIVNRQFIVSPSQGGGAMSWDPFSVALQGNKLYLNSTQEYQVRIINLETGRDEGLLRREFPRIKHPLKDWEKMFASKFNAPTRAYENDITGLFHDGARLWVQTAAQDETSGILFDVFDSAGRFADSLRIGIKGRVVKIAGDFIYLGTSDKDDLPALVKYRIAEPIGER